MAARRVLVPVSVLVLSSLLVPGKASALDRTEEDYELKLLGKYVFFDKISEPARMACVTCHDPETGGTGSVSGVNQHQVAITGADPHTAGSLKPPTNAYASLIRPFEACNRGGANPQFCGGNFWNGRAEGELALFPGGTKHIGNEVFQGIEDPNVLGYSKYFGPTADQALNPMPNPVEQNIERQAVCEHVAEAQYAELFEKAWGVPIDCNDSPVAESSPDVDTPERAFDISFKRIILAVGAWQRSSELNSFSSKRDRALQGELNCLDADPTDDDPAVCSDPAFLDSPGKFPLVGFTDQENLGHDLFYNVAFPRGPAPRPDLPAAQCAFCHSDEAGDDGAEPLQLYTDVAYHNIGTPANPEVPAPPDPGLGGHTSVNQPGFVKTPTMRNVDKRKGEGFTKAYTHNGWFKSLESLVHFYNTSAIGQATAEGFGITRCPEGIETEKDALAENCWPAAEWPDTVSTNRLVGNLGLSLEQEAALVAYLKTLTDTETVQAPAPYQAESNPQTGKLPQK